MHIITDTEAKKLQEAQRAAFMASCDEIARSARERALPKEKYKALLDDALQE